MSPKKHLLQLRDAAESGFLNFVFHDVPGIFDGIKVWRVSWPLKNTDIVVNKILFNNLGRVAGRTVMHKKNHCHAISKMEADDASTYQYKLFLSLFD